MNSINKRPIIRFKLTPSVPFGFDVPSINRMPALVCGLVLFFIIVLCERTTYADNQDSPRQQYQSADSEVSGGSADEEMIDGTADEMERYEKTGLTILIGQVKIKRPSGFLNADKVTIHEDVDTGDTIRTVAQGSVEIRDDDLFATCEHAILNHIDDTVDLRDNVVVIQHKDRLEAKHFTFNRRSGKQTGDGGVRFKVHMKQKSKQEEVSGKSEQQ